MTMSAQVEIFTSMVDLPNGIQCGDDTWIGALLTGITARKWLWTPLRHHRRQGDDVPANGGAVPSDMNEPSKREADPIAFQIHFATGA